MAPTEETTTQASQVDASSTSSAQLVATVPPTAVAVHAERIPPQPDTSNSAGRPSLYSNQLFLIVTVMLLAQLALLVGNLWFQFRNYASGISLAERAGSTADTLSLILIYSRAWDFAVAKTSALFLGFMVIYLGALYVLRSADSSYELSFAQGAQPSATLKSSSPGLVMVTLGTVLVALVLHHKSEVGLQLTSGSNQADGSRTTLSANTSAATPVSPGEASAGMEKPTPRSGTTQRTPSAHESTDSAHSAPEDHRMPKLLEAK